MNDMTEEEQYLALCALPSTLPGILEPNEALAAAQRMQRWYRSAPQGLAASVFGRDGRRVLGRPAEIMLDELEEA
jgi:hypothetical protein